MISAGALRQLFEIFIGIINWLVALILWPISMIIEASMPALDDALTNIATWLGHATDYAGWILDAFGIPSIVIMMIVAYFTYTLTTSFGVYAIKQAIKWYKALKP